MKDIGIIEKVQKRFTKIFMQNPSIEYSNRLQLLNIQPLEERRIETDLIEAFQYIKQIANNRSNNFFLNFQKSIQTKLCSNYVL